MKQPANRGRRMDESTKARLYLKLLNKFRNQSIFALGVLLIELWFGRPLEDLRIPVGVLSKVL